MAPGTRALQIQPKDNAAVALAPIAAGETVLVGGRQVRILEDIARGHKFAAAHIAEGADVTKYGYPIGRATQDIAEGRWVHTHNLKTHLSGKLEYSYRPAASPEPGANGAGLPEYFDAYIRENGDVGIRNEIWIINTVGCVNKVAERLAALASKRFAGDGVDGVFHFPHPYGCSQLGDDLMYTRRALAGLARHPNAAGVLIVGLGCENNRVDSLVSSLGEFSGDRIRAFSVQSAEDEFAEGLSLISDLADYARTFRRTKIPVSRLRIGLKCGGSDGLSGITANPLVGRVSDLLVQKGAAALLTEVPEMFGAETILMNRARQQGVFQDVVTLIDGFKDYYARHGQAIYENPSPGNKDGGITTLEEKSLGCIQKGGTAMVDGVLPYGGAAVGAGLQLVQAPGNDMVSVTALAASGAHMILFTTGRGTPMGGAVPTLKISSNTELAERKKHWIDFDAGRLLDGVSMRDLAAELYRLVIDVASGRLQARNEVNDYREIAIFKDGVTL
ncbi:MAG: UxaA family hydrolase [Bacilli bacterium]